MVVDRGGKGRVSPPCVRWNFLPCECSNKFGLLATQEEEEVVIEVGAGEGDRTPKA